MGQLEMLDDQPMLDEPIHVNQGKNKTFRAGQIRDSI